MLRRGPLSAVLGLLIVIGVSTLNSMLEPGEPGSMRGAAWGLYLVGIPLTLIGLLMTGWTWTAMACVVYGTIGLALDLSTVAGLLRSEQASTSLLPLSAASGLANFLLIVFGGRTFIEAFQKPSPPGCRPSNPPTPSGPSGSSSN